jgi:MFS family permease
LLLRRTGNGGENARRCRWSWFRSPGIASRAWACRGSCCRGSAARAGIVAFCTLLPVVLAALVGGPVIDRIGRRRVAVMSDLACGSAVAAIPLLQFADTLHFWMLCLLMAVTGLFRAPGETARGVLLPTLAEHAGMPLTRAAGLYDGASRCAALTGSALGGVLIAVLGAENVLSVDAATFAVSAPLFAFGVRGLPEAQAQRRPSRRRCVLTVVSWGRGIASWRRRRC